MSKRACSFVRHITSPSDPHPDVDEDIFIAGGQLVGQLVRTIGDIPRRDPLRLWRRDGRRRDVVRRLFDPARFGDAARTRRLFDPVRRIRFVVDTRFAERLRARAGDFRDALRLRTARAGERAFRVFATLPPRDRLRLRERTVICLDALLLRDRPALLLRDRPALLLRDRRVLRDRLRATAPSFTDTDTSVATRGERERRVFGVLVDIATPFIISQIVRPPPPPRAAPTPRFRRVPKTAPNPWPRQTCPSRAGLVVLG